MGESNLLVAPSQVVSHPPEPAGNGNPMLAIRKQRAVALVLQARGRRQGTPAQLALPLAPQRQPGAVEKNRS